MKTMGDQGMCPRSPTKMLYIFTKLVNTIQQDLGIQLLDTLWPFVQNHFLENNEWTHIADCNMKQAPNSFLGKLDLFYLSHNDQVNSLTKIMTETLRDT